MNKKLLVLFIILLLSACTSTPAGDRPRRPWWSIPPFSWFGSHGDGQEIFHWQRPHTGIEKFARDHQYCLSTASTFKLIPATSKFFHDIFYTEEKHLEIRADWNGKSGIWASFIPYPGAQPLVVNTPRPEDDDDINYHQYVDCMYNRGYNNRNYNIPDITNVYLRKERRQ